MNDEKGQLSGEYLLLIGSLITVLMISAFLIGNDMPNDKVHKAVQKSWINGQISLNGFFI